MPSKCNRKLLKLFHQNAPEDDLNKVELLNEKTREFRALILKLSAADRSLNYMLEPLFTLFDEIEKGEVVPPTEGKYRSPFHIENPTYGIRTEFSEASAEFQSALEDWPSKFPD